MTELIIITFLTGVGGLALGGWIGVLLGGKSSRSEAVLLSFSAGAMISLVCFELLTEAAEVGGTPLTAAATAAGALIVTWLDYIIDKKTEHRNDFITCEDCEYEYENDSRHEHCDHGVKHEEEHRGSFIPHHGGHLHHDPGHGHIAHDYQHHNTHHHKKTSKLQLFVAGIVMALAIAIHNIPEGMSVGAIYADAGGTANTALLVLCAGIIMHNIPEGMAVTVPLITSDMNKLKAVMVAALSGVPTVIGALAGFAIGDMGPAGLTLSMGFAAGSLLYVVFGEVLPQSINLYCSRKTAFAAIAGVIAGMLILGVHVH